MKQKWTPRKDELYFYLDEDNRIQSRYVWNTPLDQENIRSGNAYRTENEVERAQKKSAAKRKRL